MRFIPARTRVAGAAVAAMAAFGAVAALPASATAADHTTAATSAAAPVETIEGPFATEHECKVTRADFSRYYEVGVCYKPDTINAWYFHWFS
ncbi:hypothetical protein SAMN06297387_12128 [Streptomyces zhaozhouensis]|uniref:Secreted protein n=1 Tax=Streptomyces zhaozhouensis TaxID=1300267 RepID=A0A286E2Q9_9ACTN|nr:hypothetical protein [Streptomyces zhaozhouensis]SOD65169.1 hypothetical protein SAMN06297387_12128 [Streptomyces zhaozhouensis]